MNDGCPRVLVVVGDEADRQGWCAAFAAGGFFPEGVAGPPQAILAARRPGGQPPALLAVEAGMQGMGPALLARAMRSLPGLGGLPLLLLGQGPACGLERSAAILTPAGAAAAAGALLDAPAGPSSLVVQPAAQIPPVVDQAVVARVRAYGEGMFQQLVGQYLDELPQRLSQIAQALENGDGKGAAGIAHALKGSSGSLGMCRLWRACTALESVCREGGDPASALADVREQAETGTAEMRRVLATPTAGA